MGCGGGLAGVLVLGVRAPRCMGSCGWAYSCAAACMLVSSCLPEFRLTCAAWLVVATGVICVCRQGWLGWGHA